MSNFVKENEEIICPICRVTPEEPVNFCQDQSHEKCCRECISSYIQSTVHSAFLGSCPIISCPSASHQSGPVKKKRILLYDKWHHAVPPETPKRYIELASSLLAFLCGGCHALKTLDLGYDITGHSSQHLEKYFTDQEGTATMEPFMNIIEEYCSGALVVDEFYACLLKDFFPNLRNLSDSASWEVFQNVLKSIHDPERRANLHLRYLRDRPRIKTLCCHREHCFRCKVKEYHEGKTCMENSTDLDHSVVNCPTCGIALAKGDGCNTITCVCGKQFSWTAEKENTDRCLQFLQSYPEKTSERCAQLLCTEMITTGSVVQQAQAWQIRNRQEVTRCLLNWFKEKYSPCPAQSCVILALDSMPDGVRQAVEIWKTHQPREVAKCAEQKRYATEALFTTMYPDLRERPMAAHRLVNDYRRQRAPKSTYPSDPQRLAASAAEWIEHNRDTYTHGVEAAELQLAKQFLYLYGTKKLHTTSPAYVNCPFSYEWARDISNDDLTYSNQNTSVCRVGSVSCYPAAFSRLVSDHSMFRVSIDTAPRSSNWLTFGLARRGMATTSSDGVGRTANTWGVADDRSSNSMPVVSASGTNVGSFRKFIVGDMLSAEVDTVNGWFEIRLNENEFVYRFEIPTGSMEDYWFAMTFANDHQVTIQYDDSGLVGTASASSKVKICGQLNTEHTHMYGCFKKHIKTLLHETEDLNTSNSTISTPAVTLLKTPAQLWVDVCGSAETAAAYYDTLRPELQNLSKFGREYPWKTPSALPWVTWEHLLWAASWFYENRRALKEAHDAEMAETFLMMHGADAPFMAAVNLSDFHTHRVDHSDVLASLAFMRYYSDEMQEWYDYDSTAREPMVENVARGCRCLPRHTKHCPNK